MYNVHVGTCTYMYLPYMYICVSTGMHILTYIRTCTCTCAHILYTSNLYMYVHTVLVILINASPNYCNNGKLPKAMESVLKGIEGIYCAGGSQGCT